MPHTHHSHDRPSTGFESPSRLPDLGNDVPSGHTVVPWPESQRYMECDWFETEATLIIGGKPYREFGDAAYLIPTEQLNSSK